MRIQTLVDLQQLDIKPSKVFVQFSEQITFYSFSSTHPVVLWLLAIVTCQRFDSLELGAAWNCAWPISRALCRPCSSWLAGHDANGFVGEVLTGVVQSVSFLVTCVLACVVL